MMTPDEIERWIESHYGPIHRAEAHGVYLAVVGVYQPDDRGIGLGSSPDHATADLYLDLHGSDMREHVPPAPTRWERHRRETRT